MVHISKITLKFQTDTHEVKLRFWLYHVYNIAIKKLRNTFTLKMLTLVVRSAATLFGIFEMKIVAFAIAIVLGNWNFV